MELRFFPINIFRETPKVTFFDAGIEECDFWSLSKNIYWEES